MAVFTPVSADDLTVFLQCYDLGEPTMLKGIAEGVQNSNFLIETTCRRYFLTLYESRTEIAELPYFLSLMGHLADRGMPVPHPIADRSGTVLQSLNDRQACLIDFAPGVSVTEPSLAECQAAGAAMGGLHHAAVGFTGTRHNDLGPDNWAAMAASCGDRLKEVDAGLPALIDAALAATAAWPRHLPSANVHTDLFCDNVLFLDGRITGLIDFYFACTEVRAYDYAVTHAAWCFSADGRDYRPDRAAALAAGYAGTHGLSEAEVAALPVLAAGASLRFLLTRAYDWLNTPPDALVTRKDPLAFARRLEWALAATPDEMLGR